MSDDINKLIANPINQRIAQYLILHKHGTVSDISKELSDIPRPSLYRHIKAMSNAGLLKVSEKKAVRGAVEKTYTLAEQPLGEPSNKDISLFIQKQILSIASSFAEYFKNENADPKKDYLSVSRCTLMLSDSELMEMYMRIGEVYNSYINNKPEEGRKPRSLAFISSPVIDTKKGE